MQKRARSFDRSSLVRATSDAHHIFTELLETARRAEEDTDREERLRRHWCKACFYRSGFAMASAAGTEQPCACCAATQIYSSSNTDALCMPCAKAHRLCKHCRGDLDMRERRRTWPEATPAAAAQPRTSF